LIISVLLVLIALCSTSAVAASGVRLLHSPLRTAERICIASIEDSIGESKSVFVDTISSRFLVVLP
jgi:hypothetical protein